MSYQTRDMFGGSIDFDTLKEAYHAWLKDSKIWRISCNNIQWISKSKRERWGDQTEKKLYQLSEAYSREPLLSDRTFWVRRVIEPMADHSSEDEDLSTSICEVVSDTKFRTFF